MKELKKGDILGIPKSRKDWENDAYDYYEIVSLEAIWNIPSWGGYQHKKPGQAPPTKDAEVEYRIVLRSKV